MDWIQLAQDMVQRWHSSEPVDSIKGWEFHGGQLSKKSPPVWSK